MKTYTIIIHLKNGNKENAQAVEQWIRTTIHEELIQEIECIEEEQMMPVKPIS